MNQKALLKNYEIVINLAVSKIVKSIQNAMRTELEKIHKEHFYRHQICFIDGMGMVSLSIGDYQLYDYGYMYERFGHIFQELLDLRYWYLECSELHKNICIDDIIIHPLRNKK